MSSWSVVRMNVPKPSATTVRWASTTSEVSESASQRQRSTINPLSIENGIGPLKMFRADGTLFRLP